MLVLIEEAYAQAAVFSPYGSANGGIVPGVGAVDPELARGGVVPDGGVMGCPIDILPSTKPILHRSSVRKSVWTSG
jgi:hypothetical protein